MNDAPAVRVPPPLYFAAFLGAAVLLQRLAPPPAPPHALLRLPATACAIVAAVLGFASMGLFLAARENPIPETATQRLVLGGPYRFTRNPMYLGMFLLYLAGGLWWACLWSLLLAPLVVWAVTVRVIREEERYLEGKFGAEYRAYCARVRRWL